MAAAPPFTTSRRVTNKWFSNVTTPERRKGHVTLSTTFDGQQVPLGQQLAIRIDAVIAAFTFESRRRIAAEGACAV
jgi:hypothetical protein